jgi:hypothetical protein
LAPELPPVAPVDDTPPHPVRRVAAATAKAEKALIDLICLSDLSSFPSELVGFLNEALPPVKFQPFSGENSTLGEDHREADVRRDWGTVRGEISCVRMPDTSRKAERDIVSARLRENKARRGLLEEKTEEIRAELRDLLVRGSNVALDVAEMARLAGISRDTAHRYLREVGQLSWRQRNAVRNEENAS